MWIDYLLIILLIVFLGYLFWYSFFGKTKQPLTSKEVDLMFAMHKRQTRCAGTKISEFLLERGKVVGFKCECGYKYEQKRLLTQDILKTSATDEFSGWVNPSEIEVQSEMNNN
jgi:hypothetical protein